MGDAPHYFEVYISQFVLDEAGAGDADTAARRLTLLSSFSLLDATPEALELAQTLVARGAIPPRKAADAAHLAVATVHHIQFLLTWNCTHLANAEILELLQNIRWAVKYRVFNANYQHFEVRTMIDHTRLSRKPHIFKGFTGMTLAEFGELERKAVPIWRDLEGKRLARSERRRAPGGGRSPDYPIGNNF